MHAGSHVAVVSTRPASCSDRITLRRKKSETEKDGWGEVRQFPCGMNYDAPHHFPLSLPSSSPLPFRRSGILRGIFNCLSCCLFKSCLVALRNEFRMCFVLPCFHYYFPPDVWLFFRLIILFSSHGILNHRKEYKVNINIEGLQ